MFSPFGFMGTQAGGDADATAYINAVITAGGSLSAGEQTSIDTFYVNLKSLGIYSKLHVMYPVLGGVSNSNKINALNPGTYDLTFAGTWTHNVTGSATTKSDFNYADTGFNPSTQALPSSDFSVGAMIVGGDSQGYTGIGTSAANYIILGEYGVTEAFYGVGVVNGPGGGGFQGAGAFMAVSRNSTAQYTFRVAFAGGSGVLSTNAYNVAYAFPYNATWYFSGINGLGGYNVGGRILFGYLSSGLSNTELQDLADAVNTLNTTFSRNIW